MPCPGFTPPLPLPCVHQQVRNTTLRAVAAAADAPLYDLLRANPHVLVREGARMGRESFRCWGYFS